MYHMQDRRFDHVNAGGVRGQPGWNLQAIRSMRPWFHPITHGRLTLEYM